VLQTVVAIQSRIYRSSRYPGPGANQCDFRSELLVCACSNGIHIISSRLPRMGFHHRILDVHVVPIGSRPSGSSPSVLYACDFLLFPKGYFECLRVHSLIPTLNIT
jgi:hypothetical protein